MNHISHFNPLRQHKFGFGSARRLVSAVGILAAHLSQIVSAYFIIKSLASSNCRFFIKFCQALIFHLQFHMKEALSIRADKYWLTIQAEQLNLKIALLTQTPRRQAVRLACQIQLDADSPFAAFQHSRDLMELMRDKENYRVNLDERKFEIIWKISGKGYLRESKVKLQLKQVEASNFELLEFENMLLKQDLEKRCQISSPPPASIITPEKANKNKPSVGEVNAAIEISSEEDERKQKQPSMVWFHEKSKMKHIGKERKRRRRVRRRNPSVDRQYHSEEEEDCFIDQISTNKHLEQFSQRSISNQTTFRNQFACSSKSVSTPAQSIESVVGNGSVVIEQSIESVRIVEDNVRINYLNGDYYYGEMLNNMYHGYGTYLSNEHGLYEGSWVNGYAEGVGVTVDRKGNKHMGYYQRDKKNGTGVQYYANGDSYDGQFVDDFRQGTGTYTFAGGAIYNGEWDKGRLHGKGHFTSSKGCRYFGSWLKGEKDGEGELTDEKGKKFRQVWRQGKLVCQQRISL